MHNHVHSSFFYPYRLKLSVGFKKYFYTRKEKLERKNVFWESSIRKGFSCRGKHKVHLCRNGMNWDSLHDCICERRIGGKPSAADGYSENRSIVPLSPHRDVHDENALWDTWILCTKNPIQTATVFRLRSCCIFGTDRKVCPYCTENRYGRSYGI